MIFGNNRTEVPLSFVTSKNLANSEHLDTKDHSRSFTYWVTRHELEGAFLLFPQWGLAIELCNGRFVSWHGNECAHCSSEESKTPSNNEGTKDIYSLFTALLRNLCIESVNNNNYDLAITTRHNGKKMTCQDFFNTLSVGMKVQCKVCPKQIIPV